MAKQIEGTTIHEEDEDAEEGDGMGDSAVSGFGEEESMPGKNRFDVLLKSLIARIEFNNTLAPIQEYGRHQVKAANIKKKNKKKPEPTSETSEIPGAKFDENYYDLDDEFIDDGDLDMANEDEEMELFEDGDTSKFQSEVPDQAEDTFDQDERQ